MLWYFKKPPELGLLATDPVLLRSPAWVLHTLTKLWTGNSFFHRYVLKHWVVSHNNLSKPGFQTQVFWVHSLVWLYRCLRPMRGLANRFDVVRVCTNWANFTISYKIRQLIFKENQLYCTSVRDFLKGNAARKIEREKSLSASMIQTHDLFISGFVLYRCALTTDLSTKLFSFQWKRTKMMNGGWMKKFLRDKNKLVFYWFFWRKKPSEERDPSHVTTCLRHE